MHRGLDEPTLSRLSEFVACEMGLHFPRERWRDLERGIRSAAHGAGTEDAESYAQWLLSAPLTKAQIEILASELTVGETYFFRENRSFEILEQKILPELIRARQGGEQRLRIWSAGCCTGEEPYSIAILLDRILPAPSQWQVTILATDINPRFLQKASAGLFSEWSFRNPPPWLKQTYFKPAGEHRYQILPRIREKVTFDYLNLAQDVYPSLLSNTNAMDLIFCRNVLMYFSAARVKEVVRKFYRSIMDNGWLIVSPTEVSSELFPRFSAVHFDGAVLYRKGDKPRFETDPFSPAKASGFVFTAPPAPARLPAAAPDLTVHHEAQALFEQGDDAEAERKLKIGLARHGEAVEDMALLARVCANTGEFGEAMEWVEKAIAANKLDPGLHYLRAIILQEQGVPDEAVSALKRAVYLDPGFVLAHFALGNLALRRQRPGESDRHFAHTLDILATYQPDDLLPQSEGLAAGRLKQIIESTRSLERTP